MSASYPATPNNTTIWQMPSQFSTHSSLDTTKNLVVFDLDHTLLEADSNALWTGYLSEQGLLDSSYLEQTQEFLAAYQQGKVDFGASMRHNLRILTQSDYATISHYRDKCFAERVQLRLYAEGLACIADHQAEGDIVLIVSATHEFLLAPLALHLPVQAVLGTQLIVDEMSKFTGEYAYEPSFGAGKIDRLQRWLASQNLEFTDFATTYFYSDSINDLPLLEQVTHPIVVHPDEKLAPLAKSRGWQRRDFK